MAKIGPLTVIPATQEYTVVRHLAKEIRKSEGQGQGSGVLALVGNCLSF